MRWLLVFVAQRTTFRTVSGSLFEHLSKFVESLQYVSRFKLAGLQ